jgi:hypothetical protein
MLHTLKNATLILSGNENFEFVAVQVIEVTFHQALHQVGTLIRLKNKLKNKHCATAISDGEDLCSEWAVTFSRQKK